MKRFICLQAGHQNAKNNCDQKLAKGTGAPGEAEFTVRIRDRLSQILLAKKNKDGSEAFMIQLVDATYNCDKNSDKNDYALFLAIHYDADIYGTGGGFVDFPEPSTDGATQESQRIAKVLTEEYFPHSGIENVPGRSNANTRYYYMWKFLSAKTPCNIIECGVGKDEHDSVILADTDRVANAIARGICKAFDVPFDVATPEPEPTPPTDCEKQVAGLKARNTDLSNKLAEADAEVKNREEQVGRLKAQVLEEQVLRESLSKQVNSATKKLDETVKIYEGQLTTKQTLIDDQANAIGGKNIEIAQLTTRVKNLEAGIVKTISVFDFLINKLRVRR